MLLMDYFNHFSIGDSYSLDSEHQSVISIKQELVDFKSTVLEKITKLEVLNHDLYNINEYERCVECIISVAQIPTVNKILEDIEEGKLYCDNSSKLEVLLSYPGCYLYDNSEMGHDFFNFILEQNQNDIDLVISYNTLWLHQNDYLSFKDIDNKDIESIIETLLSAKSRILDRKDDSESEVLEDCESSEESSDSRESFQSFVTTPTTV